MSLIELLIDIGIDFYSIEDIALSSWPRACDPDWQSERITEDPFFVQVLAMINGQYPGMLSAVILILSTDSLL